MFSDKKKGSINWSQNHAVSQNALKHTRNRGSYWFTTWSYARNPLERNMHAAQYTFAHPVADASGKNERTTVKPCIRYTPSTRVVPWPNQSPGFVTNGVTQQRLTIIFPTHCRRVCRAIPRHPQFWYPQGQIRSFQHLSLVYEAQKLRYFAKLPAFTMVGFPSCFPSSFMFHHFPHWQKKRWPIHPLRALMSSKAFSRCLAVCVQNPRYFRNSARNICLRMALFCVNFIGSADLIWGRNVHFHGIYCGKVSNIIVFYSFMVNHEISR